MNIERIIKNIEIDKNRCWNWAKSCNSAGYGQLTENKVYWLAHRYSYQCSFGGLTPDVVIRHKCHNPKCCNPEHLIIGTHRDNWYDSEDVHRKSTTKRRSIWIINGEKYTTMRQAKEKTGLSFGSLNKYTVNGIFNTLAYRKACIVARCTPKV